MALYGKVERADNNTRGIINLRDKGAEVSFTFELGGSRYTVQRCYERRLRTQTTPRQRVPGLSRMMLTSPPTSPTLVTRKIEETIGLACQDFCRVVVLPHGKFDEFLTLTGGKMAEMLGHIFNLDSLGERKMKATARSLSVFSRVTTNLVLLAVRWSRGTTRSTGSTM